MGVSGSTNMSALRASEWGCLAGPSGTAPARVLFCDPPHNYVAMSYDTEELEKDLKTMGKIMKIVSDSKIKN